MNRTILKLVAGFILGALFVVAYNLFMPPLFRDSAFVDGLAARWVSPKRVSYGDSYELLIKGMGRDYMVVVAHVGAEGNYGHFFPIAFFYSAGSREEMKTYIGHSKVLWADEGVTIETPTGHKIFIPATMFLGGR